MMRRNRRTFVAGAAAGVAMALATSVVLGTVGPLVSLALGRRRSTGRGNRLTPAKALEAKDLINRGSSINWGTSTSRACRCSAPVISASGFRRRSDHAGAEPDRLSRRDRQRRDRPDRHAVRRPGSSRHRRPVLQRHSVDRSLPSRRAMTGSASRTSARSSRAACCSTWRASKAWSGFRAATRSRSPISRARSSGEGATSDPATWSSSTRVGAVDEGQRGASDGTRRASAWPRRSLVDKKSCWSARTPGRWRSCPIRTARPDRLRSISCSSRAMASTPPRIWSPRWLARDKAYEFAFMFAPLRLKGATGSPAIRSPFANRLGVLCVFCGKKP